MASSAPIRLCTYNIFEGLKGQEAARVKHLVAWLIAQQLDFVGLNEANGFTSSSLAELGRAAGLPHAHLQLARTGFHLGILSRHPLRIHDTSALRMHHGLLHASSALLGGSEIHVLVTHLTPGAAAARRDEVTALWAYAAPLLTQPAVLLGDLNSLSPSDIVTHEHPRLREQQLMPHPNLARKFLCAGGAAIDYEPIRMLYAAGFTDLGGAVADATTVPTPVNTDPSHAGRMRLDYVLLTPALLALGGTTLDVTSHTTHPHSIATVRDAQTDLISDHYPVVAELSRRPLSARALVRQLVAARAMLAFQ